MPKKIDKKADKDSRKPQTLSVPVRMPADLNELITATAQQVKLSKQDTIRLSLERGVEILKRQLMPELAA